MHESPSSAELVKAVMAFLTDVAMPNLSGHAQFSARVSANALALVARELEQRAALDAKSVQLYGNLLGMPEAEDLSELERQLCDAIASGNMTKDTPELLAILRTVTQSQLSIDQPNYSGLTP